MAHAFRTFLALLAGAIITATSVDGRPALDDGSAWWCEGCGEDHCLAGKVDMFADAAPSPIDEATGRDKRNFPPDRIVDYLHMKLQMTFRDLNDRSFTAIETLTFKPIAGPVSSLTLSAINLHIKSVQVDGKNVEHHADGTNLVLRFDPPLPGDQESSLVIEYACTSPVDGMFFTPYNPAAPHYSAEVHTQGEAETNGYWFIGHNSPNERFSTELIVDVPAEFQVSSNGKLVSSLVTGDRAVWHYLQAKPHVMYLVSLVIGKFDRVTIDHPRVPMTVWAPQGLGKYAVATYGRTGEMLDMFERRFGVAYPWDRYDQLIVKNFGAGGMENTSVTSMYPTAIFDEVALADDDLDGLISHELAHQWAGDLVTCKGWPHLWLNEGWATYGSAMWNEQRFGYDAYLDSIRGSFNVANRDKTTNDVGMVSNVYDSPEEMFRRPANPYPKGSSILHMLRKLLGEETFWAGTRLYFNRHAYTSAETSDFRLALEEASGLGLEGFFDQWCYRPGCPEVMVKTRYNAATRELTAEVTQTQHIDARTPAFFFSLPIVVKNANGDTETFTIDVRERVTNWRTTLKAPPTLVAVDPDLHVLKILKEDKARAWWIEQAGPNAPTIAARRDALEALAAFDDPDIIALMAATVRDASLRHTIRGSALDSLAKLGSQQAKDELLALATEAREQGGQGAMKDSKVRREVVAKLRGLEKAKVVDLLADFARNDPSYAVRTAAIDALAHHKATEQADLIVSLVDVSGQHDRIRNAALSALAAIDDPRGLDLGIKYAAYGYMDRSRPEAINAVGRLAKYDMDKAVTFLLPLLEDPEGRTIRAAGRALARTGDDRARAPLQAMADAHRDPALKTAAAEWLKQLDEEQAKRKKTENEAAVTTTQ